jgi:hypothetical protein
MTADSSDSGALSLTLQMTKSLERLLNRAAANRDLTPEALAQRILREWLLAEGGFAQTNKADHRKTLDQVLTL